MAEAPAAGTAIVLGVETQIGLAMVRELGRAGVRVVAVSHDRHAIGLASRYVWRRVVCGAQRSQELVDLVNGLAHELGPVSLLTVSEGNLNWVNAVRDQFDPLIGLAVPKAEALRSVLDKSLTLDAARRVGIDTPQTTEICAWHQLQALSAITSYPVVLKWKDAQAVASALSTAGLPLIKAEYAYDAEELLAIGRRYEPLGQWPLVQTYCAGRGLGQFFFMHRGQAVRRFQHLRVAEWPPEGGYSSVCDSLPEETHRGLQERSIALLKALHWEGVAMVEYRHDAATGRSVLMEINGRFWGSLPLAVAAGAGFVRLAHASVLGLPLPSLDTPRAGLRCRMVATEVKRLRRLWLQPQLIVDRMFRRRPVAETVRFLVDFVRPGVRYFVWSLDDPQPTWRDLRNILRRH